MPSPLIVGGALKIDTVNPPVVDMSAFITQFKVRASVDTVEVPATLATPKGTRPGPASYEIEIGYLAGDGSAELFTMLWTAITSGTKLLYFAGKMEDTAISATNPEYQGQFVVVAAEIGGDAEGLSQSSGTFPLVGAPVRDITP